jgi:hypothetical protein
MQITVHSDWETTQKSLFQCIHILFDSVSIYWYVLLMFKVVKHCFEILYWIACWFEKLSRDHQLSWCKLLKIIILNFILYIIQVYCTLIYKRKPQHHAMPRQIIPCRVLIVRLTAYISGVCWQRKITECCV